MIALKRALRNPPAFGSQHVTPCRLFHIRAEVPKVETVTTTRKGQNLLTSQICHHLVGTIAARGSFRRSMFPVRAFCHVFLVLLHPIATDGAITPGWTRYTGSIWSEVWLALIERRAWLIGSHVRWRTRYGFAWQHGISRHIIIEPIEPHGTIIRCQGPFADDDGTKMFLHGSNAGLPCTCISVETVAGGWRLPSLVNVRVQSTIGTSIHKSSPDIHIKSERIMHDKLPKRRRPLHNQVPIPIKLLQHINGRELPRFINGLQPQNGRMFLVTIHQIRNRCQSMIDVGLIDLRIAKGGKVECAQPLRGTNRPVQKCRSLTLGPLRKGRRPFQRRSFSRIIKPIL
mmetsp:Transcript_1721/g.2801  ORF Transcript_1721/g.2801 Transcript_1721/m.2801 type:complete len:343 (-) Transcript_1721:794-1822(-)